MLPTRVAPLQQCEKKVLNLPGALALVPSAASLVSGRRTSLLGRSSLLGGRRVPLILPIDDAVESIHFIRLFVHRCRSQRI